MKLKKLYSNVYAIDGSNRFVLKVVPITTRKAIQDEIRVGMTPGIEKVGVRTHDYMISNGFGYIIMDHVEMGQTDVTHMTAEAYLRKFPEKKAVFLRVLKRRLLRFYQLTKRFHGDLHFENVMVIMKQNKRIDVKLIDYGSTVRIKSNKPCETYAECVRHIRKTFEQYKSNRIHEYPPGSGISVKYHFQTQTPFRVNQNVIRYSLFPKKSIHK